MSKDAELGMYNHRQKSPTSPRNFNSENTGVVTVHWKVLAGFPNRDLGKERRATSSERGGPMALRGRVVEDGANGKVTNLPEIKSANEILVIKTRHQGKRMSKTMAQFSGMLWIQSNGTFESSVSRMLAESSIK